MKISVLLAATTGALAAATPTKRPGNLRWFGANEAGAEFGEGTLPGNLGKEYTWPNSDAIDLLIADGMNIFRIPFRMERIAPDAVDGPLAKEYLGDLIKTVNHITQQGAWAVIDPHNYGRYYDAILTPDKFQTFWANVARNFVTNNHAIFDTNNEYHDMGSDKDLVLKLNQAAINGIRSVNATSQYIFVEGDSWTGAWTWASNNDNMKTLVDPANKLIFEMHQYFDSNGGSSQTCVNSTIGQERLVTATQWLRTNRKLGFIGEFAGYDDETCKAAVAGMLKYMNQNADVWTGAAWWSAGPWWGDAEYSYEPPNGHAYKVYKPILEPFFPRRLAKK